ncbi:MAG: DNA topoisomerase I [Candidatus Thermoplasmatota archaeon]|nr:DNA topoisomerase I [Candidatus Thermoplasmatota archaeon]
MRLIICEKDNAAKRISSIMSGNRFRTEHRGRVAVYDFIWDGEETLCMGLRGHILNMDFPDRYNNWSEVPPRDLITAEPKRTISAPAIAKVLKDLSVKASKIYIATDFDREGELIGREAVDHALGSDAVDSVYRAHFSSLTEPEVKHSFSNLTRLNKALASAAETRQVLDLIWGATLTRFISLASNRLWQDFLSVGRVQSPTLAIIVDKEREIKEFKPEPYWRIETIFSKDDITFPGNHSLGDIWKEEEAASLYLKLKGERSGTVLEVIRKKRTDRPPAPFNTTELIRTANTLGMAAARIMSVAEDLYTSGYISYPRTDNTVYPKGLDLKATVTMLEQGPYRTACEHILSKEVISPTRGNKETTDHPPIYPTNYATPKDLAPEKFKLYDLIVRRFLATLHDPTKLETTQIRIDVSGELFNSSGQVVLEPGYRSIYTFSKVSENTLPLLIQGDRVLIEDIQLRSKETKPPKRYSQGGLVQEMERLGLGTKSTRHETLQKLYTRRFIEDDPPRPTHSGEALITALERHARAITLPEMTARLEEDMERISTSSLSQDTVIKESREMLSNILEEMEEHRELIGKELSEALLEQDVVGICPRCNNNLLLMRSRRGKRYVRCSKYPGCSKSYPLPQKGKVGFTDRSCEICRSPIITIYMKGKRPRDLCINPDCRSKTTSGEADGTR